MSESRLSDNDVQTLLTRIHEYYERMQDHDQNQFFSSQMYISAGENHNIGRDLNLAKGKVVYSPKYKGFATYKKFSETDFPVPVQAKEVKAELSRTDYPRPTNLERRFKDKETLNSPSKYRCLS